MMNGATLPFDRCPHCGIAHPNIFLRSETLTPKNAYQDSRPQRMWTLYECASCAGAVLTMARFEQNSGYPGDYTVYEISETWPLTDVIPKELPDRVREYLRQALESGGAPAGAVILTASAIDAMLKDKGYKHGSLYTRIESAATDHVITPEMATWAHEIRLDANDQRHSDESATLPTKDDAERVMRFAMALGQFLYVLPATVKRGRKAPAQATSVKS